MINDRDLRVDIDFRHGFEVAVLIVWVGTHHKRLEQIGDLLEIDS